MVMVAPERPLTSHHNRVGHVSGSGAPTLVAPLKARPSIAPAQAPRIAPRTPRTPGSIVTPTRVTHMSHDSVGSVGSNISPGRGRADTGPHTPDPSFITHTPNPSRPSPRPGRLHQHAPQSLARPRSVAGHNLPTHTLTPGSGLGSGSGSSRTSTNDRLVERPVSRDRPAYFHMSDLRRPETITRTTGKRVTGQATPPVISHTISGTPRPRQKSISNGFSQLTSLPTRSPSPHKDRDINAGHILYRNPINTAANVTNANPSGNNSNSSSQSRYRRPSSMRGYSNPTGASAGVGVGVDSMHSSRQPSVDSVGTAGTIGTSMSTSSTESRPGRRPGLGTLFAPPQASHQQSANVSHLPLQLHHHSRQHSMDTASSSVPLPIPISLPIPLPPPLSSQSLPQSLQTLTPASSQSTVASIQAAAPVIATASIATTASSSPASKHLFFAPHTHSSPGPASSPSRAALADASVAEARRERKILDLEISNSSLLAINRQLEKEVRKQRSELRRFRRLTRAGRLSDFVVGPTALELMRETSDKEDIHNFSNNPDLQSVPEDSKLDTVINLDAHIRLGDPIEMGLDDSGDNSDSDDALSPAASSSRLISDEKRLRLDLDKHRQVLLDNQKISNSLTKCFWKTEELIKIGKEALAYQVTVTDVPLTGVLGAGSSEMTDTEGDIDDDDLDGPDVIGSVADTYDPYTDTDTNTNAGDLDSYSYANSRPTTSTSTTAAVHSESKILTTTTAATSSSTLSDLSSLTTSGPSQRQYTIEPQLPSPSSPIDQTLDFSIDMSSFNPDSTMDNTVVSEKDSITEAMNAIRMWTNASPSMPSRVMMPRYHNRIGDDDDDDNNDTRGGDVGPGTGSPQRMDRFPVPKFKLNGAENMS